MIDPTKTGGTVLPDDPPHNVLVRAKGQARALARCLYVYRYRSNWVMTTDLTEPPSDVAVWMVPANQDDPDRQNWGGC
jgi:Domain of unknown function.